MDYISLKSKSTTSRKSWESLEVCIDVMADRITVLNVKKLYEFFLKYTYKENWTTERDEKYFSKNVRWLADVLRQDKTFKLKYCKHYILPYKKRAVKQNFNYKLAINTHVKVILERRKVKQ